MRCQGIILFLVVIACLCVAGCTQPSGTGPVATAVPVTSRLPADPAAPATTVVETAALTAAPTGTPQEIVTIVHQVSQVKDVKDSELLFSLQVPVEWSVSTYRLDNPENFEGFMYQTNLVKNNTFYIHTFTNYRSREQNYRDDCVQWSPAPNVTTVTINGLTFDRFESTANGRTNVTYVPRKNDANDYGYLSVLAFSANTSNRFEVEDYDKVVSSFRYYSKDKISTMPGVEIPKIVSYDEDGGSVRSAEASGYPSPSSGSSSGGSKCHMSSK
jgi:hypothetical protein